MSIETVRRKARIAWLNIRILILRSTMSLETGVTEEWKAMARRLSGLVQQRNDLYTAVELRRIERKRGLQ